MSVADRHIYSGLRVVTLNVLLLCSFVTKSQDGTHGNQAAAGDWLQSYLKQTGSERSFIYGREYYPYYYRSRRSPILRSDERRTASLTFCGRTYDKLILQYDTFTDEVIYTYDSLVFGNKIRKVSLNRYYVSSFNLFFRSDTMHFRFLTKRNDSTFNLSDGYYEVVHDSRTRYIVRHESYRLRLLGAPGQYALEDYQYQPCGYIDTGDGYQKITSRRQFLKLLSPYSAEIRRFLRSNKISIRNPDKQLVSEVLKYFEQLN